MRGAIQLGVETIIVIAVALIVLVLVLAFIYQQFVGPASQLSNYSTSLNISLPKILPW